MFDSKKLWLTISGSITYYLKYYDMELSNEELLKDYLEYTLNEEDGKYQARRLKRLQLPADMRL